MTPSQNGGARALTQREIEAYARDGVICARGVIEPAWIERMAAAADRVARSQRDPTPGAARSFPFYRRSLVRRGFVGDLFMWKQDEDFRDYVFHSNAGRIARQAMGCERLHLFFDQLFVKEAGSPVETPWHHDLTHWPIEGRQVCSVWLALDRIDAASGRLEFLRGSHRWPNRYKAITIDVNPVLLDPDLEDPPDVERDRSGYDIVSWDMEPGDVLVFHGLAVHGASGNRRTDRRRRGLCVRFCGDDVRFRPRPATMPILWPHGLAAGDPLGGPLFPRLLPEDGRRAPELEPPHRDLIARSIEGFVEARRAASARRSRAKP